jgi:hypothetical protein
MVFHLEGEKKKAPARAALEPKAVFLSGGRRILFNSPAGKLQKVRRQPRPNPRANNWAFGVQSKRCHSLTFASARVWHYTAHRGLDFFNRAPRPDIYEQDTLRTPGYPGTLGLSQPACSRFGGIPSFPPFNNPDGEGDIVAGPWGPPAGRSC